jgi:hypothetical protein
LIWRAISVMQITICRILPSDLRQTPGFAALSSQPAIHAFSPSSRGRPNIDNCSRVGFTSRASCSIITP